MTYNEKKSLYESIMKDIAKTVKRKINEASAASLADSKYKTKKTKYPVYDISEIDSKKSLEMYEKRFFKVLDVYKATSKYKGNSQLGVLYDENVDSFINDAFKYAQAYFNKVFSRSKEFKSGQEELKCFFMKIKSKYPKFKFSKKNAMLLALSLVDYEGNAQETAAFNKAMGNDPTANLWDTYKDSFKSFPEILNASALISEICNHYGNINNN